MTGYVNSKITLGTTSTSSTPLDESISSRANGAMAVPDLEISKPREKMKKKNPKLVSLISGYQLTRKWTCGKIIKYQTWPESDGEVGAAPKSLDRTT